jgi:glycosyltransferase involved in cell wall biosynthesis
MRRADLFALSSHFEGFPNALLEAMSEGVACVSFDCEAGPRELIRHRENGWLVPAQDTHGLAAALDILMQDDGLRARLGARAREVCTLYSMPEIIGKWNALLERAAATTDDHAHVPAGNAG